MVLEKGDIWSVFGKTDLCLFTGNSCLNSRGELVMGSGLAAEVKNGWPGLPRILGARIEEQGAHMGIYGVVDIFGWCRYPPRNDIGVFQVKRHYREKASLMLIGHSCQLLSLRMAYARALGKYAIRRVDMNFPGIGCGMLQREFVLPIISELPDAVHVWEKA